MKGLIDMANMHWHDILERAGWTFVQGTLGAVTAVPLVTDIGGWEAVWVAGLTGGVAAVISFLKTLAQDKLNLPDTRAKVTSN